MRLFLVVLMFARCTFLMSQQNTTPTWRPYPAGHWPQEPDGFNGMKFDASRAATEKVAKLEDCEKVKFGNISCKTTLSIKAKPFEGSVLFAVPQGLPPETGRLASIYAEFSKADYPFVKAAFIENFGQPHSPSNIGTEKEYLVWQGNKAEIRLSVGVFVLEPNYIARGAIPMSTIESLPPKRPDK
jgi:hypothetical protein